jgi:hypothetical protein
MLYFMQTKEKDDMMSLYNVHGTVVEGRLTNAAGADTAQGFISNEHMGIIRQACMRPVQPAIRCIMSLNYNSYSSSFV